MSGFRKAAKEEGVVLATSVETLGVDLKTRTKQLGAKEKAKRKKCDVGFSLLVWALTNPNDFGRFLESFSRFEFEFWRRGNYFK